MGSVSLAPQPAFGSVGVPLLPERWAVAIVIVAQAAFSRSMHTPLRYRWTKVWQNSPCARERDRHAEMAMASWFMPKTRSAGTRARVIPSARKNQRQSQGQKHQRTRTTRSITRTTRLIHPNHPLNHPSHPLNHPSHPLESPRTTRLDHSNRPLNLPKRPLNHPSHLLNHPTSAGPLEAEPPEQSAKSPEPPAESRATAYSEALLTR